MWDRMREQHVVEHEKGAFMKFDFMGVFFHASDKPDSVPVRHRQLQ